MSQLLKILEPKRVQWLMAMFLVAGCYPSENLNVPEKDDDLELTALDEYIEENFTEEYGIAVRYRYDENFVEFGERVTPVDVELVRPMLDIVQRFWIDPYLEVENGEEFFRQNAPAELVFLGGVIYDASGNIKLGVADAGAKITFTNVNGLDVEDDFWMELTLTTTYHEFGHFVHQKFKLPTAFETISPAGYTSGGSWFNLTEEEALQRGFVSPYGTSSPNEDFAELVSFYLYFQDFEEQFTIDEEDCEDIDCSLRNEGRERLRQKLAAVASHYEKVTGINLEKLRASIQSKLEN
jgi:substrate import-associated zinc metallohydrolase lipoprotein